MTSTQLPPTDGENESKRHFKKWLKRLSAWFLKAMLLVVMLSFLTAALSWIVLTKLFNAQKISEAMTQQIEEVFNRPVQIASLDLKFFNTVELKGFAILDNEIYPGFPFISAESVSIRYKLLPLFEHQLIIDEITLNKPRFSVLRTENGEYSVPPIKLPQSQTAYVDKNTGRKWQIHIEDWSIRNGVISYKDIKSGAAHAIYGLNMHFNKLNFRDWSNFELETVVRNRWGDHVSDLEIHGEGQINFAGFDWEKFALREFKTKVSVFRKPVELRIQLQDLLTPFFTVTATAPEISDQDLSVFDSNLPSFRVPASTISLQGRLDNSYTQLTLEDVSLKSNRITASASGTVDFGASPLAADLKLKTGWADLDKVSTYYPALKRFKLTGQGMLSGSLVRKGDKNNLSLVEIGGKKMSGSFWGFEAKGVSGSFSAKQNFSDLYAQITDGTVQVANSTFSQLKMTASYRKGNVYGYIGSALLNEVPLKLKLSINNIKKDDRTIDTSIYLQNLDPMKFIGVVQDFADVIAAIPDEPSQPSPVQSGDLAWMRNFRDRLPEFMPNFSGTLYADTFSSTVLSGKRFNGEFALTGLLPGAASLNGTLDMKLEEGVIHQMEKVAAEQEALNVTFTPFIMLHRMETSGSFKVGEVLKDVAVEEMAVSVDFKNGTMIINNAFTQGPVISAAVSGWTDWVRETFELVIWTMITPSSRRGILAENLTDENGNPALAFKISSSMLKPKLEMLRAKKTNTQIQAARKRGLRTEFKKSSDFMKGEFNAKK